MGIEELFDVEFVNKFKELINEVVEDILEMFSKGMFLVNLKILFYYIILLVNEIGVLEINLDLYYLRMFLVRKVI